VLSVPQMGCRVTPKGVSGCSRFPLIAALGVRHAAFAPFQELLPLCAAVVHHGGIGTTAGALAAGTPQLVLPLAWDQPDNAARVRRLGAGSSLGARQRSAARLAEALAELLKPEARARCRALSARFGDDDALERAAGWLEDLH